MIIAILFAYIMFTGIIWALCAISSYHQEKWEDDEQEAWICSLYDSSGTEQDH